MCRQMFVNHRLAKVAAEKKLQEAQARIDVQKKLAADQTQVQLSLFTKTLNAGRTFLQ